MSPEPVELPYLLAECLAFGVPAAIPIPSVDPSRFAMHDRPPGVAPDLTIYPNVTVCGRFVFSLQIIAGKQTRLEIHLVKYNAHEPVHERLSGQSTANRIPFLTVFLFRFDDLNIAT